jgi:TPR repeat protein
MAPTKHNKTLHAKHLFLEAEQYDEAGKFRKAFTRLLAGAKLGDAGSQLNLGNFYASGKGVRKNLEKAAYWYKKAYRNGESSAAHNLAIDLKKKGSLRAAVIWFKKAIAMNDGESCVALAKIYSARRGCRKAAKELLGRALKMTRYEISEDSKDEAESLLREMGGRGTHR